MVTTPSGDTGGDGALQQLYLGSERMGRPVQGVRGEHSASNVDMNELFGNLYNKALEGDKDCGGLLAYNYFSGEHITGFERGTRRCSCASRTQIQSGQLHADTSVCTSLGSA